MAKHTNKRRPPAGGPQPAASPSERQRQIALWTVAGAVILVFVAIVAVPKWFRGNVTKENGKAPPEKPVAVSDGKGLDAAPSDKSADKKKDDTPPVKIAPPPMTNSLIDSSKLLKTQPAWSEIDDPSKDGWDSEAFHDRASKQLNKLGALLLRPEQVNAETVGELVTEGFSCEPLRPRNLQTVFEDHVLKAERGLIDAAAVEKEQAGSQHGRDGFMDALQQLAKPLLGATDLRFKFKVIRVLPAADAVTTHQYFSISGLTNNGVVEQNATWIIRWLPDAAPRMQWIGVTDFEEVATRDSRGPLFADCTESVLGRNASYRQQMLWGCNYWLERIENTQEMSLFGNPGIALGDVNGDGLEDLYVCQEQGLPNRLYVQNEDGTLRDESEAAGVNWLQGSRSALLIDLDNDSDQDLVVVTLGNLVIAENDGHGRFTIRTLLPTADDTMSISAADFDRDGDLDLYVCGYNPDRTLENRDATVFLSAAEGFVLHDANNGGHNNLFRNDGLQDGEWRFTDVTVEVGLDVNNRRYSFASAWEDFDNDGDQDLYVANDYGRDNLYRNDTQPGGEPRFVDISNTAHAEDSAGGMSIAWGDYDRDGWMDAYVSNMFSSAGNRVTYQPNFKPESAPEVKTRLQHFARGNTLLKNRGDGSFDDVTNAARVEMGRWAWGSLFVDVNNDGWEDIFVSNGYMTADDTGDL
jgi:hypothetical protein